MIYIFLYLVLLIGIILILYKKFFTSKEEEYLVYGRNGGVFEITMSLVALVFGASSVFGLAGWAYKLGWNAIWWTLSGVIFLILLATFLVKTIYSFKGYTIIDIINENFGAPIKTLSSIVLLLAWISVLAGQIIAGGNIIEFIVGNKIISLIVFSTIFALYTIIWGQVGAIRVSFLQVIIMVIGICILLYFTLSRVGNESQNIIKNTEIGFEGSFSFAFWISVFLSVGLSYLFGPDIYSRIFSSKTSNVAKTSLILASVIIFIISIMIVLVGILSRGIFSNTPNPDNIIPYLALNVPNEIKPLVFIALISIPLSGADVILITSSSLISKNILPSIFGNSKFFNNIWFIRLIASIVITLATLVASMGRGIIPTLLLAYKIFSTTVAPLIFSSIILKLLNKTIKLSITTKLIIIFIMSFSSLYIILAELVIPSIKFDYYTIYLTVLNFILTLSITLAYQENKQQFQK
ncbi:MAG: hypothetical protein N2712_00465 [Brevinematales bacterium]|nr:hypothetical protein [Brevinematales bacterium]